MSIVRHRGISCVVGIAVALLSASAVFAQGNAALNKKLAAFFAAKDKQKINTSAYWGSLQTPAKSDVSAVRDAIIAQAKAPGKAGEKINLAPKSRLKLNPTIH